MKIFKYPLDVTDEQDVGMPEGAEILTVQTQNGAPFLWAKVDPDAPVQRRLIITRGTGHEFKVADGRYIGTYQIHGGALVFHVFDAGFLS